MKAESAKVFRSDQQSPSTYMAGGYPVPIRFLYGTAAEINFWDAICSQAFAGGGSFDTSTPELTEQTGLTRQMISELRREAVRHGEINEDASLADGHRVHLTIPNFGSTAKGFIWKPIGYVTNGWLRAVTPAIPKRVLNFYLQQPRQGLYRLDPHTIATKCQRRFLYGTRRSSGPLNVADVNGALRLLIQLGLFMPDNNGFRIDWSAFNRPASAAPAHFSVDDPRDHPLYIEHAIIDSVRAERALELTLMGQYDFETHFVAIFNDLAYVHHEDDYRVLQRKVHTRRAKLPGLNRWLDTWRVFQAELRRRVAELRSPKVALNLGETALPSAPLHITPTMTLHSISALVVIARVEWPWYVQVAEPVQLDVLAADQVAFRWKFNVGDGEARFMLPSTVWLDALNNLAVRVQSDQPMPGVRVEAWVEAKLLR